jgi:3-hydroxyisobutyrate dehydrogenase
VRRFDEKRHMLQTIFFLMFGKSFYSCGEPGKSSSIELAINYLLGLNLQGLAETILFAEKWG